MTSVTSGEAGAPRQRRRVATAIKESLRALSIQLSLLNHQVSARIELNNVDLGCLDLIGRYGPLGAKALARRSGLHPATVTGILDRLERGGWITRERDPSDRRAVLIRALRDRNAEVFRLYAGMNASVDDILAGYSDAELDVIAGFLRRATEAGQDAVEKLAEE